MSRVPSLNIKPSPSTPVRCRTDDRAECAVLRFGSCDVPFLILYTPTAPAAAGAGRGRPGGERGRSETQVSVVFSSCILSRTLFDLISPAPPRHICMRDAARFVHWSRAQGRRPLLFRGSPRSPHARGATARANAFLSVGDTTGGHVRACGSVSSHGLPFVVKITPAILTALHLGGRGLLHASCGRG